jgi:hypothetical protein
MTLAHLFLAVSIARDSSGRPAVYAGRRATRSMHTGDGEMLMGMGAFATIALQAPPSLTIVVLDNDLYSETGAQRSHTAQGTDLAAIARGCGIADARTITTMAEIESFAALIHSPLAGPRMAVIKMGFTIDLAHKDLTLIVDAANAARVPMPVGAAAREAFSSARSRGFGSRDFSTMADALCELAGIDKLRLPPTSRNRG